MPEKYKFSGTLEVLTSETGRPEIRRETANSCSETPATTALTISIRRRLPCRCVGRVRSLGAAGRLGQEAATADHARRRLPLAGTRPSARESWPGATAGATSATKSNAQGTRPAPTWRCTSDAGNWSEPAAASATTRTSNPLGGTPSCRWRFVGFVVNMPAMSEKRPHRQRAIGPR